MECINIKKLITFCLLLISISVFAQKKIEVTGIVTDENKEPLIGVNISVEGSSTGKTRLAWELSQILTDVTK